MRLLIELENEQEKMLITDKINKVKEIFDKNVEIVYANKQPVDIFEKLGQLKWKMGKKLYKDRDSLHER
jgi:hypothetical protein